MKKIKNKDNECIKMMTHNLNICQRQNSPEGGHFDFKDSFCFSMRNFWLI